MTAQAKIIFWLILYLFFPVLDLAGHRIVLTEFYTYAIFLLNLKRLKTNPLVIPYAFYAIAFFLTVLFTALLAGVVINNHDIYTLRNIVQFYLALLLFHSFFLELKEKYSREQFEIFIFYSLVLLSIPALIVYLQRFNPFGFRELIMALYKPKFFFLEASAFSEFRYTSIFQDFFTEAVYFCTVLGLLFYFLLMNQLKKTWKGLTLLLLFFVYGAQFFVARTSLLLSLVLMAGILFFASRLTPIQALRKSLLFLILSTPLVLLGARFVLGGDLVNLEWALEGFSFFSAESSTQAANNFSSYKTMNSFMENFYLYLKENPKALFVPSHDYNISVTLNPYLYTDSFYGQEIYRYGIYGILSYLIFILLLIKNLFRKSRMLLLLIIFYVFLNYKGGNVFFMEKNIYIYAFVFSLLLIYETYLSPQLDKKKGPLS